MGEKWEQTKQGTANAGGATRQKVSEAGGVAREKVGQVANDVSRVAGEKWEQSNQPGGVVQQTKEAMKTALDTMKNDVTPKTTPGKPVRVHEETL